MSYIIDRYDINTLSRNALANANRFEKCLECARITFQRLVDDPTIAGSGAEAMKQYVTSVHITAIGLINLALQEFYGAVVPYAAGFSELGWGGDANLGDEELLNEDLLIEIHKKFDEISKHIHSTTPDAQKWIDYVSDVDGVSEFNLQQSTVYAEPIEDYRDKIEKLRSDVGEYDAQTANDALANIKDLIAEARKIVDKVIADGTISFDIPYTASFFQTTDVDKLNETVMEAAERVQCNQEELKAGVEYLNEVYNDRAIRAQEKARQERIEKGFSLLVGGTIGIVTAVMTCGTAAPGVAAYIMTGITTVVVAMDTAEIVEGGQEIYLGFSNDLSTSAYNPFRDNDLVKGDQELYELIKTGTETVQGAWGSVCTIETAKREAIELGMDGRLAFGTTAAEEIANTWGGEAIDYGLEKYTDYATPDNAFAKTFIQEGVGFLLKRGLEGGTHEIGDSVRMRYGSTGKYVPPMFNEFTDEEVLKYAEAAAAGKVDSNTLFIGKHTRTGSDYEQMAKRTGSQKFHLREWDELAEKYSGTQMWRINQKYLEMQIKSGNTIYLAQDPFKHRGEWTSGFAREISYLEAKGFSFETTTIRRHGRTESAWIAVMK
ncbi:MAG: LXG domain-containing protein [Eubacterium sp.]|nr:LXG domain-containing protein [Eubacterium sp.]